MRWRPTPQCSDQQHADGGPHDLRYVSLALARKSNKRPQSVTTPEEHPEVRKVVLGSGLLRIVLLALFAAGFAVYGLWRHFTHPYKSMLAPDDSVEIPAPEIQPLDDQ